MKTYVLLPLLAFILFVPFSSFLDLKIENYFFYKEQFSTHPYWLFFYNYGYYFSWLAVLFAALLFGLSFFVKKLTKWRSASLYLILTLSIGSGVIVHGLKEVWGRPRPKQVIEFGGNQPYRPFYNPNFSNKEPSKSFPCGHCSTGYFFFTIGLLGCLYRSKKLKIFGFSSALFLGTSLGLGRMAQGGHFLSDVLAAALIMWLVSVGLFVLFFGVNGERSNKKTA